MIGQVPVRDGHCALWKQNNALILVCSIVHSVGSSVDCSHRDCSTNQDMATRGRTTSLLHRISTWKRPKPGCYTEWLSAELPCGSGICSSRTVSSARTGYVRLPCRGWLRHLSSDTVGYSGLLAAPGTPLHDDIMESASRKQTG